MAKQTQQSTSEAQTKAIAIPPGFTTKLDIAESRSKGLYDAAKLSEAQYAKGLKDVLESGEKVQDKIHALAMQALVMAQEPNNNYDWATRLMEVVAKHVSYGAAVIQLRAWFEAYGPFGWRPTGEGENKVYKFRKSNSKDAPDFDIQAAYENPWYTFAKKQIDSAAAVLFGTETLSKRIENMVKEIDRKLKAHKDLKDGEKPVLANPSIDIPVLQHAREALNSTLTAMTQEVVDIKHDMLEKAVAVNTKAA